jgi:excisionase family DNA binding protein
MEDDMAEILELRREGLSVAEACAIAGIGRTKIYEAISDGRLVARKLGKRRLILRDDLQKFLSELPTECIA